MSTLNSLFRALIAIRASSGATFRTFHSHGAENESKKSYLHMLSRMNFGTSCTDFTCAAELLLLLRLYPISQKHVAQACQNCLSVPCILESLSLKPLQERRQQTFFKSQHNARSRRQQWHFRNSWYVTQSWRILVFVRENRFHSFCGVAEHIPLFFCFPAPAALSTTLKELITPTELNNSIFAVPLEEEKNDLKCCMI